MKLPLKIRYPVLPAVSRGYSGPQGWLPMHYYPFRRSSTPEGAFPLDLHAYSTPPTFVLSQDQTLQLNLLQSVLGA